LEPRGCGTQAARHPHMPAHASIQLSPRQHRE
jgi:hypothetical protein